MKSILKLLILAGVLGGSVMAGAQESGQQMDEAYAEKIREYTTDSAYLHPYIDHLPKSATVPSPLEHFGDIIGAPGRLHYTSEIYAYLRNLAEASPRVQTRVIGRTEENREMLEVIISDAATLQNLEQFRGDLNRLADPRSLTEAEANKIIKRAKPIYYITAGLHSPETGSPEMVMELAYRLAVEESELAQNIRENVIFIFTPAAEPDGRDRIVDLYKYRADNRDQTPGLRYWGHYVAHDNNRDGFGLGLALTRNILASFLHWKATVMHDLHESVPYLYVSTGTGPYNEYVDAITVDEWHNLSHEEVTELTRRGMPGVWTHGFYNGWAANYLIWIANIRNATGRFYETFGNSIPDTKERKLRSGSTSRQWYRSNPPLEKTMWSLRNNTNYMQTGVLVALNYAANHRQRFVENFYLKSKRAVQAGKDEAPHAFVIPAEQRRTLATATLVNLLQQQGLEVHRATSDFTWAAGSKKSKAGAEPTNGKTDKKAASKRHEGKKGDYVIRLDQPYRTLARVLLDRQNFPKGANPPYDDTGWSLPLLHQVETHKVNDPAIFAAKMERVSEKIAVTGGIEKDGRAVYALNNTTEDQITVFRFRLKDVRMHAAEEPFTADKKQFAAGSFLIRTEDTPGELGKKLGNVATELGLELHGLKKMPDVPVHEVETPRVGLVHTWVSTPQDAGWWRLAFDDIGIPYSYLSEQDLATESLDDYDVLIMPRARASAQTLVGGVTEAGDPLPWQKNEAYPHLGHIDETADQRKGMGYDGVKNLKSFIEKGGVFITEGTTVSFPIEFAITRRISVKQTRELVARGSVLKTKIADKASPITYGYVDTLAVYFSQRPVLQINKNVGSFRTPDWLKDEMWQKEVPRTVLEFAKKDLLLSGMLRNEKELAGTPAVVDVPVGEGHVVLFANRPFWRWETRGSHALVFNTMLHWNDLRAGWPERPDEDANAAPAVMQGHEFQQYD